MGYRERTKCLLWKYLPPPCVSCAPVFCTCVYVCIIRQRNSRQLLAQSKAEKIVSGRDSPRRLTHFKLAFLLFVPQIDPSTFSYFEKSRHRRFFRNITSPYHCCCISNRIWLRIMSPFKITWIKHFQSLADSSWDSLRRIFYLEEPLR